MDTATVGTSGFSPIAKTAHAQRRLTSWQANSTEKARRRKATETGGVSAWETFLLTATVPHTILAAPYSGET
jgi:hypothetical protein